MNSRLSESMVMHRRSRVDPDHDAYFDGTLMIRQQAVPNYRVPLFESLAHRCRRLVMVASKETTERALVQRDDHENLEVIRLPARRLGRGVALIYWQQGLRELVDEIAPNAIITEANPRFADTATLQQYCRQRAVPFVGWGLGTTNFFNHGFKSIRGWRRTKTVQRFDSLIAYGSLAKQQYVEDCDIRPENIYIAPNAAVDVRPEWDPTLRQPFAGDRPLSIMTIGRLIENKELERLIDAAERAKQCGMDVEVHYIGDGPFREELHRRAESVGVPATFWGHLEGDALAEVAMQRDLFVLPGLGGLAIQQSMAFGLPAIVAEADGTERDLIRDNGWHVDSHNTDAIVEVIKRVFHDPDHLRQKAIASYEIARDQINVQSMASRMIDAVNSTERRLQAAAS